MAKFFKYEATKWRVIDSHWVCVDREMIENNGTKHTENYAGTLADYLWLHNFDIPETITYCLAENMDYKLKYRVLGGAIHIRIVPIK